MSSVLKSFGKGISDTGLSISCSYIEEKSDVYSRSNLVDPLVFHNITLLISDYNFCRKVVLPAGIKKAPLPDIEDIIRKRFGLMGMDDSEMNFYSCNVCQKRC